MIRRTVHEAGFTLIEVLMAVLLMTIILGALASVTAQWMPNWNRGMARVQRLEKLALALDRISADLAVAEMIAPNGPTTMPLFEGNELSVSFVRIVAAPNVRPGLEVVRFSEQADREGLALVRERAIFAPDQPARFGDRVVLLRAPFRVMFGYAGTDRIWQPAWRGRQVLPESIRLTVRDGTSGAVLNVSTIVTLRIDMPPDCARALSATTCLAVRQRGESSEVQL